MVLCGTLGPGFGTCDARGAAPLCVAGVALGDIHLRFQVVLGGALGPGFGACDARGAAPLCVAGVALACIHLSVLRYYKKNWGFGDIFSFWFFKIKLFSELVALYFQTLLQKPS